MESISISRDEASSSSSASSSDGFGALLGESLAALAGECPEAYREMLLRLGGAAVLVDCGGERVVIMGRPEGHTVRAPAAGDGRPAATLTASPAALLGLLDGEHTPLDCLLDDRMFLRGAVPTLLAVHEALVWYLRGAVRTTAFPALLERFRGWARRRGSRA